MQEKRLLQRFVMNLPVRVTLSRNGEETVSLKTCNISSQGAFVETTSPYPVGSRLDMDVFLLSQTDISDDIIRTSGEVVRVGPTGVAIRFDESYQVLPINYRPKN